jgi:hypothetical protein
MRIPPQSTSVSRSRPVGLSPVAVGPSQDRTTLPGITEYLDIVCYNNCMRECLMSFSPLMQCETLCRAGCTLVFF